MISTDFNKQMFYIRIYLMNLAALKSTLEANCSEEAELLLRHIEDLHIAPELPPKIRKLLQREDWEYFRYLSFAECQRMEDLFLETLLSVSAFTSSWLKIRQSFADALLCVYVNSLDSDRLFERINDILNKLGIAADRNVSYDVAYIIADIWEQDISLVFMNYKNISEIGDEDLSETADILPEKTPENGENDILPDMPLDSNEDIDRFLEEFSRRRRKKK